MGKEPNSESDMIERVARAIVVTQLLSNHSKKLKDLGCVIDVDQIWPQFEPEACAAIKAMQEPIDDEPYIPNENTVRIPMAIWRKFNMGVEIK